MPTPLRSVRARLGIVVERPWTGLTAGEALRQNHGAESVRPRRAGIFTAEAVKSRHRVQPQRTHAPCWGGVGLRAASAPERAAPRSGHLALYHHKIASILRASGGRSSRARLMKLLMVARRISTPPCYGASQSKTCKRGQIGRFITTRQRLNAILRRHRYKERERLALSKRRLVHLLLGWQHGREGRTARCLPDARARRPRPRPPRRAHQARQARAVRPLLRRLLLRPRLMRHRLH